MLFAASAIVTRPALAQYRFKISAALWCRYGSKTVQTLDDEQDGEGKQPGKALNDWFTLALFGRHATVREVRTWLGRCETWLKQSERTDDDEVSLLSSIEWEVTSPESAHIPLPDP
jgi:hypothetical protein